jgi:hypothetical protein
MVKDGANLLASQTKIKKKGQNRKTQTRVGLGILLLLLVSAWMMMPGLSLMLCLLLKMMPGGNQKTPMVTKQLSGTKLDHQTNLVAVIGVNQNFPEVLVRQAGTRERQLGEIVRIVPGADLLETLKPGVGSGKAVGEAGAENLGIRVAEMTKKAGRAHGIMTVLQSPLGGLIHG